MEEESQTISKPIDAEMRKVYNKDPEIYDQSRYASAEGIFYNKLIQQILKRILSPLEGKKILDIPNGTGRISLPLAAEGAVVTGADISEGMLSESRRKAEKMGIRNITFELANCRELPFPDNSFDAVTSFKFFHLVENEDKPIFISEMYRVVHPGGRLILEFESPFYGILMAAYRYYFRRKIKGRMHMRCLFPSQVKWLFGQMKIKSRTGVKIPFSGKLAKIFGTHFMQILNLVVGKIPGIRYLMYTIIFEIEKQ